MGLLDRRVLPEGMVLDGWHAPDGWLHRRFDWPASVGAAPRGSLLFQAGRADYIEKYIEAAAHWHDRGWHVAGFDWRGQGGSGRMLDDPATGHLTSLDPLVEDLAAFVTDWQARTPAPHVLIGHSMGGHLVLRLLADREVKVDAAVLVAPMLGLNSGRLPDRLGRIIAGAVCRIGRAERRAWEQSELPGPRRALQRRLTGCVDRHADSAWWKDRRPELGLGPPSWGWIAAAYASIARLDRPGVLEQVALPILLLAPAQDRLVRTAAIRAAAARLPNAELIVAPQGAHELLREVDAVRIPLFVAIDDFLEKRAPAR
jgi:lysophospholipase